MVTIFVQRIPEQVTKTWKNLLTENVYINGKKLTIRRMASAVTIIFFKKR